MIRYYKEIDYIVAENYREIRNKENANHTEIFAARWEQFGDHTPYWDGSWYLNFTQIPSVQNSSFTIALNNIFLVKMQLKRDYAVSWA